MSKTRARLFNYLVDKTGGAIGKLLSVGVKRGWVYFPFASEALSCLPFSLGWKLRRAVYARVLTRIGTDVILNFGVILEDPHTSIGDDVWISVGTYVDYAEIGDSVLIGQRAVLLSGRRHHHFDRLDIPIKQQGNPPKEPLLIGSGVWIGAHATVMADVGHDAIVGAGAVVTKPVPPYAIVGGNPARILRMRGDELSRQSAASSDGQQESKRAPA
jgi:acetyltransferase-like isoleucine patch superfamily enzyme